MQLVTCPLCSTDCLRILIDAGFSPNCFIEDGPNKLSVLAYAILVDSTVSPQTLLKDLELLLKAGAKANEQVSQENITVSLPVWTVATDQRADKVTVQVLKLLHKFGCEFLRIDNKLKHLTGSALRIAKKTDKEEKIVDCIQKIVTEQEQNV